MSHAQVHSQGDIGYMWSNQTLPEKCVWSWTPWEAKHPHTIILSSCLTVAFVHHGANFSLRALHTRLLHWNRNHRTVCHCSKVQWRCSMAHSTCFFRLFSLMNGFFELQYDMNALSCAIRRLIVHSGIYIWDKLTLMSLPLEKRLRLTLRTFKLSSCSIVFRFGPFPSSGHMTQFSKFSPYVGKQYFCRNPTAFLYLLTTFQSHTRFQSGHCRPMWEP